MIVDYPTILIEKELRLFIKQIKKVAACMHTYPARPKDSQSAIFDFSFNRDIYIKSWDTIAEEKHCIKIRFVRKRTFTLLELRNSLRGLKCR